MCKDIYMIAVLIICKYSGRFNNIIMFKQFFTIRTKILVYIGKYIIEGSG